MKTQKSQRRLNPLFLVLLLLALGLVLLIFLRGSFITKQEEPKVIDVSLPIIPETKEF